MMATRVCSFPSTNVAFHTIKFGVFYLPEIFLEKTLEVEKYFHPRVTVFEVY